MAMTGWWKYSLTRLGQWLIWILLITLIISGLIFILYASEALIRTDDFMPVLNPDFTLNLTTEFIGIFLTVGVLDRLIAFRKRRGELPARAAALRRIRTIHHNISRFWMSLVLIVARIGDQRQVILDFDDLTLFDKRLAKVINRLDFKPNPGCNPPELMSRFVSGRVSAIQRKMELVTQGYGQYLSPPMLAALDQVEDNPFITTLTDELEERVAHKMVLFPQPNNDKGDFSSTRLDQIIETDWYEDFIPAIFELGRVIAAEISAVPDPRDRSAPSDGQSRKSVGRQPPSAEDFDPECTEILNELLHYLQRDLYQSQQAAEAGAD